MNKDGTATIKVKYKTYLELKELGSYNQSMDDIVSGLLHPGIIKSNKAKRRKENLMKK